MKPKLTVIVDTRQLDDVTQKINRLEKLLKEVNNTIESIGEVSLKLNIENGIFDAEQSNAVCECEDYEKSVQKMLEKQLELLFKRSTKCGDENLNAITSSILDICIFLKNGIQSSNSI